MFQAVADALSTPRRALWSALGLPDSGSELLGQKLGMDTESPLTQALGLGAEVVGDPLTWGGGLIGGLGARALRGLIPAVVEGQGAGRLGASGLASASKFKGPLADVATVKNARLVAPGESLVPGEVAGLERAGGRVAGQPAGRSANLGQGELRRRLDVVGGSPAAPDLGTEISGLYNPESRTIVGAAGEGGGNTLRHERVHAIVDQAAGTPQAADLPPLMRTAATLRGSSRPLFQDAGKVFDELAAQSLEHRGTGDQLMGAASFLFNPEHNAAYADVYRQAGLHPLVTGAYSSLPGALVGAGGLAGGGVGGGVGYLSRALQER